ncbi:hypothetical protein QBC39DRAFT_351025 [Podospora conica]|nr:hypothetical protein QBC39DRAFT_351025 [Schizothecium conicum]
MGAGDPMRRRREPPLGPQPPSFDHQSHPRGVSPRPRRWTTSGGTVVVRRMASFLSGVFLATTSSVPRRLRLQQGWTSFKKIPTPARTPHVCGGCIPSWEKDLCMSDLSSAFGSPTRTEKPPNPIPLISERACSVRPDGTQRGADVCLLCAYGDRQARLPFLMNGNGRRIQSAGRLSPCFLWASPPSCCPLVTGNGFPVGSDSRGQRGGGGKLML